jgi:glycosyltransferase involved in cell wall biosynthesis
LKVCFITDSYPPNIGGAEIAIQKIAEGVYNQGIEVLIITTKAKESFKFTSQIPDSKIIRIQIPRFLERFWFLVFSLPVILIKCRDANLLHGTSYGGVLQTYIAAFLLRKPAVVTIHEFMGKRWNSFTSNMISAYLYRLAEKAFAHLKFNRFIAVSEYSKATLVEAGVPGNKISVIYNGESDLENLSLQQKSEIRKGLNIPDGSFLFAAYGRSGVSKGFESLIEAIPLVLREISNSIFLLILSPGDKKIWRNIIRQLKKINSDRLLFYQSLQRERMLELLNASDSVIIPSLSEGFGFTTLESCMMGKIVIASNAGAIPEVIYGKHILIKPGSVEDIVKACDNAYRGLFNETEKKSFQWESSINNYIKVYEEILN